MELRLVLLVLLVVPGCAWNFQGAFLQSRELEAKVTKPAPAPAPPAELPTGPLGPEESP